MAQQVQAQVIGGSVKVFTGVNTVEDLREEMELPENYAAKVNGEDVPDDYELKDYNYVTFSQKVKGASAL